MFPRGRDRAFDASTCRIPTRILPGRSAANGLLREAEALQVPADLRDPWQSPCCSAAIARKIDVYLAVVGVIP